MCVRVLAIARSHIHLRSKVLTMTKDCGVGPPPSLCQTEPKKERKKIVARTVYEGRVGRKRKHSEKEYNYKKKYDNVEPIQNV